MERNDDDARKVGDGVELVSFQRTRVVESFVLISVR